MNEPKSLKSRLITGFKSYSLKINWFVFILICIFSWSGWIEVFAIWSELPLMINKLPEGWRLPGILNGIVQIGQVGSLLILIGRNYLPKMVTLKGVISVKLVISTILILVLSFYWDFTLLLWNEERSIALFSILFMFSLLGGSATLFFVPYISESFKKEYIIPYYIGETLFGVIPSVLAIVQGVGDDSTCVNVTNSDNLTTLEPTPMHPAFSISVYFIIIFAFLALSSVAFVLINCLDLNHDHSGDVEIPEIQNGNDESSNTLLNKLKRENDDKEQSISTTRREKLVLFILNFLITFFYYGVLPGIQSYSTIPYGSRVFHLSINLGNLFLPVSIFLSVWSYNESVLRIVMEFLVAMSFTTYLIITSVMSPCPPFLDSIFGPILTVACWIFSQTIFMRCRCIISTRLERFGERTLLISGSFTIIGEVFGGLILYFLIEHFRFFEEAPKCVFDLLSYCENI